MTCELKHTFTDHRFKDRESVGCIPMYTEQEKTNIFPSSILAYKKIKEVGRQFRSNNNESNNNLEIKAA